MARVKDRSNLLSRRRLLETMKWAPVAFLSAPMHAAASRLFAEPYRAFGWPLPFSEVRLSPHYPAKSPLEEVIRKVVAGTDEFITEKYAFEIAALLEQWSRGLRTGVARAADIGKIVDLGIQGWSLTRFAETPLRQGPIEISRRKFANTPVAGRGAFLEELQAYFATMAHVETAELQITSLQQTADAPMALRAVVRYDFVGVGKDRKREQRIGQWQTQWVRDGQSWKIIRWESDEEFVSRTSGLLFRDVTQQALGGTDSYQEHLRFGVDHWRTVLDGACGIDVYGNNGVAAGDFDGDGFDDLYVCQPPGLPNRLYRNRGDGTFEDVTEKSGLGVLDGTACALFADFENTGLQDLLVVCAGGPLLFVNQGGGRFALKRDAFQFAQPPAGTFTHAAVADYDNDGRLDVYFCVYSYYVGLDQYRYPAPYFDARNGPPNFLFHNEGARTFRDSTAAAGLTAENDRYSFACAWGDCTGSGHPDLYVANDFGRSNLYRNKGDGTFQAVSSEAGVDDAGAGMSACWLDFDGDGKQDLYVGNMWSAAGQRVSQQENFQAQMAEDVRELYRRHARGNSLYRNLGNGRFHNVGEPTGVSMGRWAWCSDAWDFDHDGHADLYVANGYISAPRETPADPGDLASFFWRQVVAKSPANESPSPGYEQGWNAINELIRSDSTWNGYERNVLYLNNGDGTFSDVSGIAGMDFLDDSRSFALADIDHDGRLEVILKNRSGPQIRVLRNAMEKPGNAIAFRLRGQKSNRDAIGAAVTVATGSRSQTKYVQAGSGFLAQHSKELFFGLGELAGTVSATIRWPGGFAQTLEPLPVNHRIEVVEGSGPVAVKAFVAASLVASTPEQKRSEPSREALGTWLLDPLPAPQFSLPDLSGKAVELASLRGAPLLLHFWSTGSPESPEQLRLLQQHHSDLSTGGAQLVAVNLDDPADAEKVKALCVKEGVAFPSLLASPEVAGIYNIIYRYLFDRRRDLALPTSFLLDKDGNIVKIYQGPLDPEQIRQDLRTIPRTSDERVRKALPFPGLLCQSDFRRNQFTYGVALFQHGYLEQAAASFQQVIATNPENPEAHYNLGTLYLRTSRLAKARQSLEQAVKLRSTYPEAWNNLGMIAAQENKAEEAVQDFKQSLQLRPDYPVALLNLGNLYRRQGDFRASEELLLRALKISPDDPEVQYNLGMLYARQQQFDQAVGHFQKALSLRPDYPDALNNLGVLFAQAGRNSEAEEKFQTCIRVAPGFDQAYLNLAQLYMVLKEEGKAKEVLQALLRLQPGHKLAQQALEMLN